MIEKTKEGGGYKVWATDEPFDKDKFYDIEAVFTYAASPIKHEGDKFDLGDIARVERFFYTNVSSGGWDGDFWAVVQLSNGKWAYINGGHDSTGYDCQGGGTTATADDLDTLLKMRLDSEARFVLRWDEKEQGG